jgi:hypothetical protein
VRPFAIDHRRRRRFAGSEGGTPDHAQRIPALRKNAQPHTAFLSRVRSVSRPSAMADLGRPVRNRSRRLRRMKVACASHARTSQHAGMVTEREARMQL